jgi:hypothetical protein
MYLLRHVPVEDYWSTWQQVDEVARFFSLTPADRHLAWRERTEDDHFHEWPVPMDQFLFDPYYVGPEVSVRPVIGGFLNDFWSPTNAYELFVFIGGLGAGKSFAASLSLMYSLYCLSCMKKPQRWLSQFPGAGSLSGDASIVLMNASAAGRDQASKIVYGAVFDKILASPYFRMHFQPYPDRITELHFPNHIALWPGSSQWQSALGWNLFGFVIDEAAFGVESDRADYVRELFMNLNMRRRSRFGNVGFGGLFTSPGSEYGYVELLAAEEWDPSIMVRRTTTWDAKDELHEGAKVFLVDRDPDSVRILESDLTYVSPGKCLRDNGEIVHYKSRPDAERLAESPAHAISQG